MTTAEQPNGLTHRHTKTCQSDDNSSHVGKHEDELDKEYKKWKTYSEKVKVKVLEQIQDQLGEILDRALTESFQPPAHLKTTASGKKPNKHLGSQRMDDGKVFVARASLLDELFEISHIHTIYHMFIAVLLIFCLSTLAVDYIDQGRLVLEFDLLFFAFGKLWTVTWVWAVMFLYTLSVPFYTMMFWGSLYHNSHSKLGLSLSTGLILFAVQSCILGVFPVYMVVHHQLPPASRFIVILEQIRFLMKAYSFIREVAPVILKSTPKKGETPRFPTFSSYLYFLFCPTLIFRESYPRNSKIRWQYVFVTFGKILGCLFYGYFILVRLCIPVFRPETNQPFSKRTMVLAVFNSILPENMKEPKLHTLLKIATKISFRDFSPIYFSMVSLAVMSSFLGVVVHFAQSGETVKTIWSLQSRILGAFKDMTFLLKVSLCVSGIMLLLLCFFAFLHCWLNLFGELLRFADRMFYKDWWNSTSFANYYRTWNVVVHDWLYYYGYRDFLWLSNRRFRAAAMLSVFIVSAVVHEYALAMGFGFFYPVMFCLFAVFGVLFNFTMNDKRQSPVFNVIMWACLFLGQGVQVCLYCQEWYAQIHCPRTGDSFWEIVLPRSWSCSYQT